MSTARVDPALVEALTLEAAAVSGFSLDAILPDAIRRVAARFLAKLTPDELLARSRAREADIVHALCQAVSVGETFFFRHPEHFRFVSDTLVPELATRGSSRICAWSAGCATGEEAYSLAACLLDSLPFPAPAAQPIEIEVLGTDLSPRNLTAARGATYGAWSRRPTGPLLHPLFQPLPDQPERVRIIERVRQRVRFAEHNLLEPASGGPFDLIFCRNVLVYFARDAIERSLANLSNALAPGGAICFGSMDATLPPPGLVLTGPVERQIFRKPDPQGQQKGARPQPGPSPSTLRLPEAIAAKPARRPPPEPVPLHLRALVLIERGERAVAEKALAELVRAVPDYLPGILERALLHGRNGERTQASALMREVLRRTEQLAPEELLAGPELLPVRFYRESAEAFLRQRGSLR